MVKKVDGLKFTHHKHQQPSEHPNKKDDRQMVLELEYILHTLEFWEYNIKDRGPVTIDMCLLNRHHQQPIDDIDAKERDEADKDFVWQSGNNRDIITFENGGIVEFTFLIAYIMRKVESVEHCGTHNFRGFCKSDTKGVDFAICWSS